MSNYNYNTLCHHGIKGQKWGIRRYQNEDGTLTAEGRKRYGTDESGKMSKEGKKLYKKDKEMTELANKEYRSKDYKVKSNANLNSLVAYSMAGKSFTEQALLTYASHDYGKQAQIEENEKYNKRIKEAKEYVKKYLS